MDIPEDMVGEQYILPGDGIAFSACLQLCRFKDLKFVLRLEESNAFLVDSLFVLVFGKITTSET